MQFSESAERTKHGFRGKKERKKKRAIFFSEQRGQGAAESTTQPTPTGVGGQPKNAGETARSGGTQAQKGGAGPRDADTNRHTFVVTCTS